MSFTEIGLYATSFLAIASIYFVAVVSPGPDFVMTMRNSLCFSRRTGLWSALGTTSGMCLHLTYTVLGISYVVEYMPWLLDMIKVIGGSYLIYIGIKSMSTKNSVINQLHFNSSNPNAAAAASTLKPIQAFRMGFLTNALNPMVVLLFMGILSSYVDDYTPKSIQLLYGLMIVTISLSWFSFVALCFSNQKVQKTFRKMGHWVERITGLLLIVFGLKIVSISIYEIIYPPM